MAKKEIEEKETKEIVKEEKKKEKELSPKQQRKLAITTLRLKKLNKLEVKLELLIHLVELLELK